MDGRPADIGRKGRGTGLNPAGRFLSVHSQAVDDGWGGLAAQADDPPAPEVVTDEIAKAALSWNASPDVPFDRSVNPYRGCAHGCVYCFARPTHGTAGLSAGLDFETRLFAKTNVAEALRRELARSGYAPAPIYLSGVTDAYQPLERTRRLTRAVLDLMLETRHPVAVVTKSALVTRDADVLAALAAQGLAQVLVSVTTLDAGLARRLEPRAAAPKPRLEAIRRLSAAGVPVGLLVAPVIPGLTDHEVEAILAAGAAAGARWAGFTMLRLPGEVKALFDDWLDRHAPLKKSRVLGLQRALRGGALNDPRFGHRMQGQGPHHAILRRRFAVARRRLGLAADRPALRCDLFRRPRAPSRQGDLFADVAPWS